MKNNNPFQKRVAIVYPFLPHYRYGVFKEIDERIEDVLFVSDRSSRDGSIAVTPPSTFKKEINVRNKWLGPILWQRGLGSTFRKFKPDIVIFLGDASHSSTWLYTLLLRLKRRKVYFWTIGWHRPDSGVRGFIRSSFYRLANGLLLYGNYGRKLGLSAGYPAEKMSVIYNSYRSLTNESVSRLNLNLLPDGSRPTIGAVIRLSPNKGLTEIIHAAALLRDSHGIEVDCLIIGEGPESKNLEALAARLGVHLYLPGAAYHSEDLEEIYRRLTVTVVPKAAGLTVLQSLSAGAPVVTIADPHQQMPEFEAIKNDITGSLVSKADGESIAQACATWIGRSQTDHAKVETACKSSVEERWSAASQAELIIQAINASL